MQLARERNLHGTLLHTHTHTLVGEVLNISDLHNLIFSFSKVFWEDGNKKSNTHQGIHPSWTFWISRAAIFLICAISLYVFNDYIRKYAHYFGCWL